MGFMLLVQGVGMGGGAAVVARQHDEFQPERMEFADGFGGRGFDRVGNGERGR